MAESRHCDRCNTRMPAYFPRKRHEDQMLCPMCKQNVSRQMTYERYAVRIEQGPAPAGVRGVQRFASFIAADMPSIVKVAHDSGDGETIFHCPMCGSGQVLARSDGSVLCEFCNTAFTVQIQPQYPAFPQTSQGMPVQVPGMPYGGESAEVPANNPMTGETDPMAEEDPNAAPDAAEEGQGEAAEGQEPAENENPFAKNSFKTASGAILDEDHYLQHLALMHLPDRKSVLAKIRRENKD